MTGGPHDGFEIPFGDTTPPTYHHFAGLPYERDNISATAMKETPSGSGSFATVVSHIPDYARIDYKLALVYKDVHKQIAIYTYWHGEANRFQ